jgi:TPR repeat protein
MPGGPDRVPTRSAALYNRHRLLIGRNSEPHLGWMYVNGWGVPKDAAEGMTWIRKAAEQGDAYAQLSLGFYYWSGLRGGSRVRVPPDFAEAVKWYRKAAEQQGHADANLLDFM